MSCTTRSDLLSSKAVTVGFRRLVGATVLGSSHSACHGRFVATLALLPLLAAACGGGGGGGGEPQPPAPVAPNEAIFGPEGGTLTLTDGVDAGVSLTVPPGVLGTPTRVKIVAAAVNPQILSVFPVYRFEPASLVSSGEPFTVTFRASDQLFSGGGGADTVAFRQDGVAGPWAALGDATIDYVSRQVTVSTLRLGDFVAWNGTLHRLFTQDRSVLDPALPTAVERLSGQPVPVSNGSSTLLVGRGSLASFWSSPATDNLLIVHGLIGSPVDFLGADDLVASLPSTVKNIVLLAYPSASGVQRSGNALYDEIQARRQPGFGCSILGHSLGGLVARYLLERAADDPTRPGYRPQDEPLGQTVASLVLLGVPNAGADLGGLLLGTLLPLVPETEQSLLQAAIDISFRNDAITLQLNGTYIDNPTLYHTVYGDIGGQSDGVVTVASALAVPRFGAETATLFPVGHQALHTEARQNGVAAHIAALLQ
jgi:hypothetical protein